MSYDKSERIKREHFVADAGGGATTTYGKHRSFADRILEAVHLTITVAGTAAGHGFDLYVGTGSVGSVTLATGAANGTGVITIDEVAKNARGELEVPAGSAVSVKSKADIVGKADVIYRFRHEA